MKDYRYHWSRKKIAIFMNIWVLKVKRNRREEGSEEYRFRGERSSEARTRLFAYGDCEREMNFSSTTFSEK